MAALRGPALGEMGWPTLPRLCELLLSTLCFRGATCPSAWPTSLEGGRADVSLVTMRSGEQAGPSTNGPSLVSSQGGVLTAPACHREHSPGLCLPHLPFTLCTQPELHASFQV